MNHKFDVIIIGSGIAGNSFALKVAEAGLKACIITKKNRAESNTNYAQGGIAAVTSQTDDTELHIQDTLTAGDGLCDEEVVRTIIKEGPERIQELIDLGVNFTRLEDGLLSLGKEGGHSKRRILHVKDLTGRAIESAMLSAVNRSPNITVLEHHFAIEIVTHNKLYPESTAPDRVVGLYVFDEVKSYVECFDCPAIMLSTGGAGQVYLYTTNPGIATGDGIAMAYRAGATIRNMECIQFHPTTLFTHTNERFLISEAVRGEGAILRNLRGEAFMPKYDERKDLAPRDIVARSIDSEMKKYGDAHVWLDITHHSKEYLHDRFPYIFEHCLSKGLDMSKDYIPVVPAAHYLSGGVKTNLHTETDLCGLYACGEVASTGLHGANRLASNSLLEAVVMAHRGAKAVKTFLEKNQFPAVEIPAWESGDATTSDEKVVLLHNRDELKRTMWDYVGIVRSTRRLDRAVSRLANLYKEINDYYWNCQVDRELLELRNLIVVAQLIVSSAAQRKESRGLHYTIDFPDKSPTPQDTLLKKIS